jgi:hypothetical protein
MRSAVVLPRQRARAGVPGIASSSTSQAVLSETGSSEVVPSDPRKGKSPKLSHAYRPLPQIPSRHSLWTSRHLAKGPPDHLAGTDTLAMETGAGWFDGANQPE